MASTFQKNNNNFRRAEILSNRLEVPDEQTLEQSPVDQTYLPFANKVCTVIAKPSTISTPYLFMRLWKLKNNWRPLRRPETCKNTSKVDFPKDDSFVKAKNTGKSPKLGTLTTALKGQCSKNGMALCLSAIHPRPTAGTS